MSHPISTPCISTCALLTACYFVGLQVEPENDLFFKYYGAQKIWTSEADRLAFHAALKRKLPLTFRISTYDGLGKHVLARLQDKSAFGIDFKSLENPNEPEVGVLPPAPISWYRDSLGWYFVIGRKSIKRYPSLQPFKTWLVGVSDAGTVTRQEAVSMIPPLFLDVQPHHRVLDMCAAPGSKTCQLLEALHKDGPGSIPTGFVIANDADTKRAYLLTHQVKRLSTPCFVVTNHEAQFFPSLFIEKQTESGPQKVNILFDRILCDVPCSGDGTLRKNRTLWKHWSPKHGMGLHILQFQIAYRAAQLLAPGGILVYSTCTFNPIENEAVVALLLHHCGGALEIVESRGRYPTLRTRSGLMAWKVMDRQGNMLESHSQVPEADRRKIIRSMFPPSPQDAKNYGLEKCMRLVPQDQDTGGFFVTVLRKTGQKMPIKVPPYGGADSMPNVTEAKSTLTNSGDGASTFDSRGDKLFDKTPKTAEKPKASKAPESSASVQTAKPNDSQSNGLSHRKASLARDPYDDLEATRAAAAYRLYGIDEKEINKSLWFCQRLGQDKRTYLAVRSLRDVFRNPRNQRLCVINAGMRVFERSLARPLNTISRDRLSQESLQILIPRMQKQVIQMPPKIFVDILKVQSVNLASLGADAELKGAFDKADSGGIALQLADSDNRVCDETLGISAWKTDNSLNILAKADDRKAILYAIGQVYPELVPPPPAAKQGDAKTQSEQTIVQPDSSAVASEVTKASVSQGTVGGVGGSVKDTETAKTKMDQDA